MVMICTKKIILTSLSGQLGGLELRLRDEARFLNNFGYSAELALNSFSEIYPWIEHLKQEGIPFHFFDPPPFFEQWRWRRFNKIRASLFYRHFFNRSKVDLVHVAFAWTETGGTRLWLAHKASIPTVISVHNTFPFHEFTPWHEKILVEAFESVKGIYAVSDSALQNFINIYSKYINDSTLLDVIYNPVDVTRFYPSKLNRIESRKRFGFCADDFVMGVVGRLDKQKRPDMLINVFSRLKRRFSNLKLVFIGQGNLDQHCHQIVDQLNVRDSVSFLGYQAYVEQILPMLDLHVLFSLREGFGIATAEAMACGVPVVAANVPGSRDILENSNAGMLVSPDNLEKAVEAIALLIADKVRRDTMAMAGPLEVQQRFGVSLIEQKLQNFYEKVL